MAKIGLQLNLTNLAASSNDLPFNSIAKVGDKWVGATDSGLMVFADDSYFQTVRNTDNNAEILAKIKTLATDFGSDSQKRIRALFLAGQASGKLRLTTWNDNKNPRTYDVTPLKTTESMNKIPVGRDGKGLYWSFQFENRNGAYFEINKITVIPTILVRNPTE